MQRFLLLGFSILILTGCEGSQSARLSREEPATYLAQLDTALPTAQPAEGGASAIPQADLQRRVIYDAQINLVVKDFSTVEAEIPNRVRQFGGYLADVSVNRTQGRQRSGRWQARIPVDQYDAFLESISALGIPENLRQTAQDVTEEFVDLEARIANQKRLEERIVQLLQGSTDKITDVIEVERELGRVRGDIERMEGRLRYLTNRTELTTVTIDAREVLDYVPPEAPGFVGRVDQAWRQSVVSLKGFGENVAVALVYAFPWLLVLGAVLVPPVWYVRKRNGGAKGTAGGE